MRILTHPNEDCGRVLGDLKKGHGRIWYRLIAKTIGKVVVGIWIGWTELKEWEIRQPK